MIFIYIMVIFIIFIFALAFILPVIQAKKSNLITEGTIISIRCKKREINDYGEYYILYFPTFKFNVDGKEYIKESSSAVSEDIYREGQKIKVAYYKENPMDAIILTDKKSKIIIGIGLTIVTILGGFSLLLSSLRGKSLILSPSYILAVVTIIVLIICYFIIKKIENK